MKKMMLETQLWPVHQRYAWTSSRALGENRLEHVTQEWVRTIQGCLWRLADTSFPRTDRQAVKAGYGFPTDLSSLLGAKPLGGLEPKSIPWYRGDRCSRMLWQWGYFPAGRATEQPFSISACGLSTNLEGGHGPCPAYCNWKSLNPDVDCFTQFSLSSLLCSVMSTKEERGQGWLGQEAWSRMHTPGLFGFKRHAGAAEMARQVNTLLEFNPGPRSL